MGVIVMVLVARMVVNPWKDPQESTITNLQVLIPALMMRKIKIIIECLLLCFRTVLCYFQPVILPGLLAELPPPFLVVAVALAVVVGAKKYVFIKINNYSLVMDHGSWDASPHCT